ncbi:MAG: hypothetical protein K0R46_2464, partial [Herbinix sp.]|nr:hypothetical protein [Herbinix sp.]
IERELEEVTMDEGKIQFAISGYEIKTFKVYR